MKTILILFDRRILRDEASFLGVSLINVFKVLPLAIVDIFGVYCLIPAACHYLLMPLPHIEAL
jgi:hypothetical protein